MKNPSDINQSQRLFIELGTPLFLEPEDLGCSVVSQLIGMRMEKYLIVNLSDNDWTKSRLKNGDSLLVKYVCSGNVFGFDTQVIAIVEEPDII